jgi:integrase
MQRAADGPTVVEFIESLAMSSRYSPRTVETYWPYWKVFIRMFGDRPLRSITAVDCEAVVEAAFKKAKARYPERACLSSKESAVGSLGAVLNRATKLGLEEVNPALAVGKPRQPTTNRRALTPQELDAVWDAVSTSRDPGLDLLLIRFHLWSGVRSQRRSQSSLANHTRWPAQGRPASGLNHDVSRSTRRNVDDRFLLLLFVASLELEYLAGLDGDTRRDHPTHSDNDLVAGDPPW